MKKVKRVLRRSWARVRMYRARFLRWWHRQDRKYTWRWRAANGFVALLLLATIVMPVLQSVWEQNRYELSAEASRLVGSTDQSLAKQLTYDAQNDRYQFNKDAIATGSDAGLPTEVQKASVGAADKSNTKSYSLDVPEDFSKGVTYHDTNSQLGFSLVPQFDALRGKVVNGHIVFPMGGDTQAIYTLKNNGLKEDIVVPKATQDTMRFSYDLQLPKTLVAKALPDGSGGIGIYSADPSLFSNISYGSDKDRQAVEKARETADKTYLVFGLPAPVITTGEQGSTGKATARFELNNNVLTVVAENLDTTKGTISIDPSVVVTATSDFQTNGNNEGMIDFGTSGQINRGGLTGGTVSGGWTATTSFTTARRFFGSAAYNGYLYVIGGTTGTSLSDVQYAPINSNGTIGSWTATTSLGTATNGLQAVAYNGYMYILGGSNGGPINTVQYAPINANGTIGSWTATTSFTTAREGHQATIYNGYLYILGGNDGTNNLSDVQYAPVNADGTVGTWTTTTSLPSARRNFSAFVYNGYIYFAGGYTNTRTTTVQYAKLNNNGTIGSWAATTSLTSGRQLLTASVYNGYLYVMGGDVAGSPIATTEYALINANGTIGSWAATSSFTTARQAHATAAYNGYLYVLGGVNSVNAVLNDVQYAQIDRAGQPVAFGTLSNNFTTARALSCSVAYNGYLYNIGGSTADSSAFNVATVQYASLNSSTGNNGSWTATTSLPAGRGSSGCVAHNGYLYVIGGYTGASNSPNQTSDVLYIAINSNGTLGASWTTSGNSVPDFVAARPGVFTYGTSGGSYIYVIGADQGEGNIQNGRVRYAALNASTGAVGSWTTSGNTASNLHLYKGFAQVGKYLYMFGGHNGSTSVYSTVEYTSINNDGSINAWASTTSLNTAIGYTNGTTVNGCIYSVGGENGAGTSLNNVQYACPNANGTISAWYNAPNLTVATTDMGVTSYNGYIYGVGGYTTSVQATTQYAYVNNGGSGSTGTWSAGTSTGASNDCPGVVANNGYLYKVAGEGTNNILYASINADGTLGSWSGVGTVPNSNLMCSAIFAYGGYLRVVGGSINGSPVTTTGYYKFNDNGTFNGGWTATTSLPAARSYMGWAAYNGYVYVMGGWDGSAVNTTVYYAPLNTDGSIGTWNTTTSFTGARSATAGFTYNGYLYVLNGYDGSSTYYNDVQYAVINGNGTVGSWNYTSSFATPRIGAGVVAQNGFVYLAGGTTNAGTNSPLGDTQYAAINANGTLGKWGASTSLNTNVRNGNMVAYNGYIYNVGGVNASGPLDAVQYAPLNSIARTARYSKLIDLGNPVSVSSITYNGTLPTSTTTPGVTPIYFRAAGSDGVFGSLTASSAITAGATACLATSQNYKRYLEVTILLDGSGGQAILPDAAGTLSNITDFTVNYITPHPAPNIRLRHGQTLQTGNLSPLDTCYP